MPTRAGCGTVAAGLTLYAATGAGLGVALFALARPAAPPAPRPSTSSAPARSPTLVPGLLDAARPTSGQPPARAALPAGSTSVTLGGLDPAAGYSFQVGPVVAFGKPTVVAWSAPTCIRGAVARPRVSP